MDKDSVYQIVKQQMSSLFEIKIELIESEKRLDDDLDLDSIDPGIK